MKDTKDVMDEIIPLLMKWQIFQQEIENEIRKFPSELLSLESELSQFIIHNRPQVEILQERIMELLVEPIEYDNAILALSEVKKLNELYSQLVLKFKQVKEMTVN